MFPSLKMVLSVRNTGWGWDSGWETILAWNLKLLMEAVLLTDDTPPTVPTGLSATPTSESRDRPEDCPAHHIRPRGRHRLHPDGEPGPRSCRRAQYHAPNSQASYTYTPIKAFFQEDSADGIVSLEAEHHDGKVFQGGYDWTTVSLPSGYSGDGAMEAIPNSGANVNTGYATNSPRLDFDVYFVKTGTHYVWVRGSGPSGEDDSCHVGLDGSAVAAGDRISSFGIAWTWSNATLDGPVATFDVPPRASIRSTSGCGRTALSSTSWC